MACLDRGAPVRLSTSYCSSSKMTSEGIHAYKFTHQDSGYGCLALLVMKEEVGILLVDCDLAIPREYEKLEDAGVPTLAMSGFGPWLATKQFTTETANTLSSVMSDSCVRFIREMGLLREENAFKEKAEYYLSMMTLHTKYCMLFCEERPSSQALHWTQICLQICKAESISIRDWLNYKDGVPFMPSNEAIRHVRLNPETMRLEYPLTAFRNLAPSVMSAIMHIDCFDCHPNFERASIVSLLKIIKSEPKNRKNANRTRLSV